MALCDKAILGVDREAGSSPAQTINPLYAGFSLLFVARPLLFCYNVNILLPWGTMIGASWWKKCERW